MASAQLLASYHIERDPVAKGVLNLTDRITRMATMRSAIAQSVRDFLLPVVSGIDFVGDKIADRLAELSVSYRHSPIVESHGPGRPRAGDRAPDAEFRDEKGEARRLFELFCEARHVLLIFLGPAGNPVLGDLPVTNIVSYRIARGQSELGAELRDLSGLAHAAYALLAGGIVLVRPDGYVAYRSNDFDSVRLRAYLARVFGPASEAAA